jgi:hypothetical protein
MAKKNNEKKPEKNAEKNRGKDAVKFSGTKPGEYFFK